MASKKGTIKPSKLSAGASPQPASSKNTSDKSSVVSGSPQKGNSGKGTLRRCLNVTHNIGNSTNDTNLTNEKNATRDDSKAPLKGSPAYTKKGAGKNAEMDSSRDPIGTLDKDAAAKGPEAELGGCLKCFGVFMSVLLLVLYSKCVTVQ